MRRAGASVVEIPDYRWSRTDDSTPLRRLVGQAVAGTVDAITFTSAPAVMATLAVAAEDGLEEALLAALPTHVVAACVGPVTAPALDERGAPTVQTEPARLGGRERGAGRREAVARQGEPAVPGTRGGLGWEGVAVAVAKGGSRVLCHPAAGLESLDAAGVAVPG